MVCLNIIVLGTNWSRSRCMRCPAVAGDFEPVYVEGKAEYLKRWLREAIVYLGGCNCQPRQRNRNETSPSLLGDREGRARPGDRNTCVNKYDSKGNRFISNYLQFLWG